MELLTKNFKLIGGILIFICCLLPFGTAGFGGFGISFNGFFLFQGEIFYLLAILLIVIGAAALIAVDLMKKDITLAPKFTLSCVAKLAVLGGGVLALVAIFITPFVSIGFGLILEVIVALALLFEGKIVAMVKK